MKIITFVALICFCNVFAQFMIELSPEDQTKVLEMCLDSVQSKFKTRDIESNIEEMTSTLNQLNEGEQISGSVEYIKIFLSKIQNEINGLKIKEQFYGCVEICKEDVEYCLEYGIHNR